ncbi:type II secretion system F family protein [soil metagenome]
MPNFSYSARDENGVPSNGTLTAASVQEVGQMLRAEGKYPISVRGAGETDGMPRSTLAGIRISRTDVIQFSTQIAIMVETGVTLIEALDCVANQANKPNVRRLVEDLSAVVRGGNDLSSALARHPRSFPRLYIALIKAAEKSGMLSKLLHRATQYLRDEHETIRRVRGALTYPGIMFAFACTTTLFLLAFVLPRFTTIYANKGAALPVPTRVLMAISGFIVGHWATLLLAAIALAAGFWFFIRSTGGRRAWHAAQLRIPLVGNMFRTLHLARGMRMIGTMATAGINLVECVSTANALGGNVHYQEMWNDVYNRIQQGKPMAEALANSSLVPRSIAQMIHSGEKGGKLGHVMEQVANFSEQELKEKIADLTRYIEPAMIIVMGAIIGGVSLALMLPIFTISRVVAH